ncbi:dickkopf-related protein 3-like isoform X2 [Myxocyprinus asiaticus]|uniref:dickkopf-related protein 3-like isoform X2 n=1 Tax=Myxocyprinus asiaticus TaxID=70543 RepID=UPI002221BD2A|nr:dickkopf-related protein 3-like isoform X2 [Myxocyprinus asiaticus]
MMFLLRLSLCLLGIVNGIVHETSKTNMDIIANMETNLVQGQTKLNEMFREVEELMEDTQQKLEDAVHQMDNESAKSSLNPHNVSSHLQNESSIEITAGNQSMYIIERTNKECVIDEDCEKGGYCLYETHSSKCLPCKQLDATCTKDEECCAGQLCVWGQCSNNSTKGEAGTICQYQSDCKEELCCAFHKALLFPVCSSKPLERERCIISANHLMELLSWDMEGEGPQEHCPCAGGLQCQHRGRGALCLKYQNSSEEDLTDALYSEVDYIV